LNISDETGLRISLRPVNFSWDRRGQYMQQSMAGQVVVVPYGVLQFNTTSPLKISPERNTPFEGALRFYGEKETSIRMLFSKPGFPGSYILDGPHGFTTIGQL
jgi:hypothetical protein